MSCDRSRKFSCSRDRGRGRDWSDLPSELVEEIILKIGWPEDVVSFSCVCRSWSTAFNRIRPKWSPANPWLLLSENTHDNPECLRKAYNPGNNKCYHIKLPETFGKNCWGSGLGWIVTYGVDSKIDLFNPLTKTKIELPSTDTMMPEQLKYARCDSECPYKPLWMRESHILKARVLEISKGNNGELLVAVIHARKRLCSKRLIFIETTYLSIARPGDTRWTLIDTAKEIYIEDVLFWKDLLWFVDHKRNMWYVDLNKGDGQSLKAMEIQVESDLFLIKRTLYISDPIVYLVKSSDNRLLLVQRSFYREEIRKPKITRKRNGIIIKEEQQCPVYDPLISNRESMLAYTHSITVYKLDLSCEKWEPVDDKACDLGRSTMFLGKNTCMLVAPPKSGTSNCMSNAVYFAGDHDVKSEHDMGICDEDGNHLKFTALLDSGHTNSGFCNPFWFAPRFY